MKVVLFGQAAFGQRVLAGLQSAGHEIVGVYAPPARGGRADPLAQEAEGLGVPLHTPPGYKDPAVAEQVKAAGPDLGVLAFVTKIIPPAVIDAPRHGTLCFHPSLLPRYRGGSALAWQLIRGETRGGLTVFWTDAGIDTGPILLQREVEISPDDTAGSLYFDKIFEPGVEAMVESVNLVAAGRAPRTPQDESAATYDPLCTDEHAAITWAAPMQTVYDQIRGCDPQPGAHATWNGQTIRIYAARRAEAPDPEARPGTILAVDGERVVVRTGEGRGALAIGKLRIGTEKIAASEAAARLGLAPGSVLEDGAAPAR